MKNFFTLSLFIMFSVCCYGQQPKSEPVLKYRMDSMVIKLYDEYTGQYENNSLHKYIYNEDQQVISDIWCFWGLTWYDVFKEIYYYNANTQLDSTIHFGSSPNWVPDNKTIFNYYPDGKLHTRINCYPGNNNWREIDKLEYEYLVDTIIEYNYSKIEGIWMPQTKTIYEYTDGLISVETRLITDNDGGFINSFKNTYEYQNGNLIKIFGTSTDYNYEWLPYHGSLIDYIYDNSNNLESYAAYYRMDETSEWILDFERNNSYDNQFEREDLIIPSTMDELNYRHMLVNSYENTYYNDQTKVMFLPRYNPVMVEKVKSILEMTANVYPNPTKDNITLSWEAPSKAAELSIFDNTGSLVNRFRINNNSTISVTDLSNGLHMYMLTSDGNVIGSGKFVVGR